MSQRKNNIISQLTTVLIIIYSQIFLSYYSILLAGLLPFIGFYSIILFTNLVKNHDPTNQLIQLQKIHAAEHLIATKKSIFSWGCSNSHIIIWLIVNLILLPFINPPASWILSMFISGEMICWLYFHQESWIAKALFPLIQFTQSWNLMFPEDRHIKIAQLTMDKLNELEGKIE